MTCLLILFVASSCLVKDESPIATTSDQVNYIQSGDIIVTNLGNDSIVLLGSDGHYKDMLYDLPTDGSISFPALTYDPYTKKILFSYDSSIATLDAIYSIDPLDGTVDRYLSNSNLTGTLNGIARLTNNDLVIIDATNQAEKFLANKTRSGAPFIGTLTANAANVSPLSTGGFVVCSSGTTNTVRTYDAAGALQATASSVAPTPSLGAQASTACLEDPQGRIVVAYSGTTDAVRVYSANLSTVIWTYTDTNNLQTPTKLAVRENGNILVADSGFNHIVEINTSGGLVGLLAETGLVTPAAILVVP